MQIVKFQAENFKKLTAIEITPSGNIVTLTGKNGAGKTSVLDGIAVALCGAEGKKLLRKGQEKGKVRLDLGEFVVTRKFTLEGDYLKVETPDGFEKKSPQKFLDSIVGKIAFDPMNFINADAKEQRRILVDLSGINLDKIDLDAKNVFESRTIENRYLKDAEGNLKALSLIPGVPEKELSMKALLDELDAAKKANANTDKLLDTAARAKEKLDVLNGDLESETVAIAKSIKDVEDALARMRKEGAEKLAGISKRIADGKDFVKKADAEAAAAKAIPVEPIQEKISECEEINIKVRKNGDYKTARAEWEKRRDNAEKLTKQLETLRQTREDTLKAGKFPITGLSFNENGVLFNDIPLDQISAAERVRVALAISMALNPQLRVLRITDGSLLDSESWKVVTEMAAEKDFQVWVEKVDETGSIGFYIEDGALKTATEAEDK